ncbi:39S ribosomal protein L52, mitochondrial-like isoform X3 [Portunus trituberculatus]|uniref:39S ribosomal protein L52, mitochondrial-like isoform X3 n=1 Tax=Portunus trituberculatus TaxID=210409 RepID=UPI001E1CFCB8|nr:39S ribosomal protein L52, mitochondrial-like isoform X3 [Portunus trituberculatus]
MPFLTSDRGQDSNRITNTICGMMRWHSKCQMLLSATVTKNFSNGFKTNLGAHGPLIDGPDYTFLDGRPTPLRIGQIRRARAQREAATKVVQLMSEVQFAIQREKQLKQEQEDTRQQTIASKLKAKGHKMLQDQEK